MTKYIEEVCSELVKLNNFKYTYNEFKKFIIEEKKIIKNKEKKKKEKMIEKKDNIELTNYRNFILYHRNNGYDLKETLELWNTRQKK